MTGPALVLAIILLALACGPAGPLPDATSPAPDPRRVKTLILAEDVEPERIRGTQREVGHLRNALHQRLATPNERDEPAPQLALELPSRAQGTWLVRPDGSMQTTYRIRRSATWHDGTPLTARDFVFSWRVASDPDLPADAESRAAAQEVAQIETPDDFTLVIDWKRPYAGANALVSDAFAPLPVHVLLAEYEAGREQFWRSPYWTREFVGVGPFRLREWQPGSHVLLEAYDGFYAGRPRIDRLTIRFIPNEDALVAHMLAGAVDFADVGSLHFEQAVLVKAEWERAGRRPTAITRGGTLRYAWVQTRDPSPRELLDVRVRRGLVHALDRQTLADAQFPGLGLAADTFIPTDDFRWDWVREAALAYPYDPRRAEELFAEAGLRRGPDGVFASPAGERMAFPAWISAGPQNERELAIVADQWKRFGVAIEPTFLGPQIINDRQRRVSFPALFHSAASARSPEALWALFHSTGCPTEANAWTGNNLGCSSSPAVDQLVDNLRAALDPEEQRPLYGALARHHTESLPLLPLYFTSQLIVVREGLTGVRPGTINQSWNLAEWDLD